MGCYNSNQLIQIKNQIKYLGDRLENLSQENIENSFMKSKKIGGNSTIQQNSQIKNVQEKLFNEEIYEKILNKIKSEQFAVFKENKKQKQKRDKKQKDQSGKCQPLSNEIQNYIRNYYQKLINQKLQAFNEGKLLSTEFKNQLSWYIVNLNLVIMQKIVKQPTFEYTGINFKSLEEFQKQFLGFLKKKYPRGDNLDAGQLSNEFKELIDFTDQYQNDILTSAGFYFDSQDEFQIMKKIKLFINKLIDQTSKHYKTFQHFMKKQVFNGAEKDSFVIGRKIPQNVSKYKRIDKNSLEIHSNEIFRIMVKWIQDLQETVKNPSQKISSNSEWCFVRKQEKKKPQLIKCAKYYRQMFIQEGIYKKIQQFNQLYKKNKQKSQIQKFNVGIINSFNQVQRYSPLHILRQQAQIIKFSEYNMKYHKQNVELKLIQLIQILVKAASQIKNKITYDYQIKPHKSTQIALNLVKFKISDLLRCKFQGNKEQIIEIKKKFQKLQSENKIKIIKIKNRFNTDLSDAMIIFKILKQRKTQNPICEQNTSKQNEEQVNKPTEQNEKLKQQKQITRQFQEQCYLICQCQLILTQKSKSSNKKLYNIQTLNHYLYELERSPFKVLGQSILQLNYKYDIIKYASKIKIIQSALNKNFCKHQNTTQIKKLQVKNQNFSMVCGRCWVFYQPFQNTSKIKACTKCFLYLCYKCNSKQKGPIQNNNEQNQSPIDSSKKQDKLQDQKQIQQKIRQKYLEYFTLIFNQKQSFIKESLSFQQNQEKKRFQQFRSTQQMLSMKRLTKEGLYSTFHQSKQNLKQCFGSKDQIKVKQLIWFLYKEYHQMDYEGTIERMFFMIMSFSKNRVILRGYKYEAYDQRLVNVQNQQQSYEGHQLFQLNEYDVLYYSKAYEYNCKSKTNYQKILLFQKSKQLIADGGKQIKYCCFDFYSCPQTKWIRSSLVYDVFIKTTRKPSLEEFQQFMIRKRLVYMSKQLNDEQIMQLKTKFYLKKPLISKKHFNELKLINLQNNKLKNPSKFLEDCKELQILILKNNLIEQIRFNNSLDSLQVLELKNNQIKQLEGLQNLKCLKILNLQNNKLEEIFNVKNSEGDENQQCKQKRQFIFPFLNSLNLSNNKLKFVFKIHALKLESIYLYNNQLYDVSQLLSSSLENLKQLHLQNNKIRTTGKIAGSALKNTLKINLSQNQLQDVSEFLSSSLDNLKQLNLSRNKIRNVGKIAGSALKIQKIILSSNQLQDFSELLSSSLENLKYLDLRDNKIRKVGKIAGSALKIQTIDLSNNQLQDVSEFLSSSLDNFKFLELQNNKIKKVGKIAGSALKIQTINISSNRLQDVSELLSSSLENLKQLYLQNNKISNIKSINKSQFSNLREIWLTTNKLIQIPDLNTPFLQKLELKQNELQAVTSQEIERFKCLKVFNITLNQFLFKIPILNHPTLQQFYLLQNKVGNILQSFKNNLPKLKKMHLSNSTYLNQLPNINNFTELQQLQLVQCPIVLDDTFKLLQQQNSQYSKLKVLKLSIKTTSQQQFNIQKQKIQKILSTKIKTLQITQFIQKAPPKQQPQQPKTQQIQIESTKTQPQNVIIAQTLPINNTTNTTNNTTNPTSTS